MSTKKSFSLSKNKFFIAIFALVIGVAGAVVLFQSRAAVQNPPAPAIYLTPTNVIHSANQTFTVAIRANSGSVPMYSASADFSYPTDLLEFQNIDTTNTAFKQVVVSEGGNGRVYFVGSLRTTDPSSISGDHLLAVVTFKTKTTSGTANLAFQGTKNIIYTYQNQVLVNLIDSLDKTYGATFTIDTEAPQATINSPTNGAQITKGSSTPITVSAQDDSGTVSSVEIKIDESTVATLTNGSGGQFTYTWDTSNTSLGSHEIRAIATDPLGNSSSSSPVTVQVVDRSKPSVTITSPSNNAKVSATTTISASASDNVGGSGISKVEFYVDGQLVGQPDTTSPYSVDWDTTTVPDGNYSITAIAYDKANPANTQPTSSPVNVTVENSDTEAPTTPNNFRGTDTTPKSITLAWNASTDNVNVVGYRITRNGSIITTTDKLTFTDTNLTADTVYNYTVSAVDAAGNSSQPRSLTIATSELPFGDFDGNGEVNLQDLNDLILDWGSNDPRYDLDGSGETDLADLTLFIINYPR